MDNYPTWVCKDCGKKYSTKGQFPVSTWHIDTCGVCGEEKSCTEPRDFYYPEFPGGETMCPLCGEDCDCPKAEWHKCGDCNTQVKGARFCTDCQEDIDTGVMPSPEERLLDEISWIRELADSESYGEGGDSPEIRLKKIKQCCDDILNE